MRNNYLVIILATFILLSCESYPEADFYEVNGIVSIEAASLPDQNNWITLPYYTSVSKISYQDSLAATGRLSFPFFIRRPGTYSLWTLTSQASANPAENALTLRVLDNRQFLVDDYRLQLSESHALEWMNRDSRTGEEISVFFPEPGHYSVIFESGGRDGYVIDKLFMSLNDGRKPEGFAFPETNNHRVDPVLSRRDQRVVIPPAWSFGMVAGTPGSGDDLHTAIELLSRYNITPNALVYTAGYISEGSDPGNSNSRSYLNNRNIRPGMMLFDADDPNAVRVRGDGFTANGPEKEYLSSGVYDVVKLWPGAGLSAVEHSFGLMLEAGAAEQRRAFVLSGLENIYRQEIKEYPASWSSAKNIELLLSGDYEGHVTGLKESIGMVANPRMSTYEIPFLTLNIGSYYRDISLMDEEEIIRWFQFLSFYTMMYINSGKEDVLETILKLPEESRKYIGRLLDHRRQLFPYLYSLAHLVRPTGVKPVRGSADHPDQFFLGNSFLVAPVYKKGATEREVFLPQGTWYHYRDGTAYRGGEKITVNVSLYEIPVLVKAGSIIPYRQNSETISGESIETMRVDIYGGDRGTFRLYEDDGITTRYQLGEFSTTAFRYFEHEDYAMFTIGRRVREYLGQPEYKEMHLSFKFVDEPTLITVNDETLGRESWSYDDENRTLHLNRLQPHYQKTDFYIQF